MIFFLSKAAVRQQRRDARAAVLEARRLSLSSASDSPAPNLFQVGEVVADPSTAPAGPPDAVRYTPMEGRRKTRSQPGALVSPLAPTAKRSKNRSPRTNVSITEKFFRKAKSRHQEEVEISVIYVGILLQMSEESFAFLVISLLFIFFPLFCIFKSQLF
jgi:hypothetical protein